MPSIIIYKVIRCSSKCPFEDELNKYALKGYRLKHFNALEYGSCNFIGIMEKEISTDDPSPTLDPKYECLNIKNN